VDRTLRGTCSLPVRANFCCPRLEGPSATHAETRGSRRPRDCRKRANAIGRLRHILASLSQATTPGSRESPSRKIGRQPLDTHSWTPARVANIGSSCASSAAEPVPSAPIPVLYRVVRVPRPLVKRFPSVPYRAIIGACTRSLALWHAPVLPQVGRQNRRFDQLECGYPQPFRGAAIVTDHPLPGGPM